MQLSALEGGFIANLLKGSMKGGLAKAIPPERHATALVFAGDVDPLCDGLAITNRLIGHAFLVDSAGRVRWRACGVATELSAIDCGRAKAALDPSAGAIVPEENKGAPRGCSRHKEKWYFNTHATGSLDGESEPVCKATAGHASNDCLLGH